MTPQGRTKANKRFIGSLLSMMMGKKSIHPAIVTLSTDKSTNKDIGVIFYTDGSFITIYAGASFLSNSTNEKPYETYETKIKVTLQNGKSFEAYLAYFDVYTEFTVVKINKKHSTDEKKFPQGACRYLSKLHRDQTVPCVDMVSDGHYEKSTSLIRDVKMGGECGPYIHCDSKKEGPGVLTSFDGEMIALKIKKCAHSNLVHALPFGKFIHIYRSAIPSFIKPIRPSLELPNADGCFDDDELSVFEEVLDF